MIQSIGRFMPLLRKPQTIRVAANALSTVPFNLGPISGVDSKCADPLFVQNLKVEQVDLTRRMGPKSAHPTVASLRDAFNQVVEGPIYDRVKNSDATRLVDLIQQCLPTQFENAKFVPISTVEAAKSAIKSIAPEASFSVLKADLKVSNGIMDVINYDKIHLNKIDVTEDHFLIISLPALSVIVASLDYYIPIVAFSKDYGTHVTAGVAVDALNQIKPASSKDAEPVEEKLSHELNDGVPFMVTTSGMSAINIALHLDMFNPRVWVHRPMYACTDDLFRDFEKNNPGTITQHNFLNADSIEHALKDAAQKNKLPSVLFFESSPNPLANGPIDVLRIIQLATPYKINVIVDHTFLGGVSKHQFMSKVPSGSQEYVRIIHSATKQLSGGMLNSTMGCLSLKSSYEQLNVASLRNGFYGNPARSDLDGFSSALDSFRSRIDSIVVNNTMVSNALRSFKLVGMPVFSDVSYSGGSAMSLTFNKCLATPQMVEAIFDDLTLSSSLFNYAVSLGSINTVGMVPGLATHTLLPDDIQELGGITPYTARISVGSSHSEEDVQQLIIDIKLAISRTLSPN
ncbi:MAG: aminotransferase class I/II-fold pyridoxal phosphate-dependent enzyme [Candidatus Margulisiibacteriota bacterium]|nr:aminotransferase class I/II-fold pyridoxal phosphate-dependent enzyme [Candidatus Margulisiibacteriota bacterium]